MFLSKRSNGIYYLWFEDESGKTRKVSTACKLKSDALKFLRDFKSKEHERRVRVQRTLLSQYKEDFLAYAKSNRTKSTQAALEIALRVFIRDVGDIPLQKVGVREIEAFLVRRKEKSTDYTVRFYYIALAAVFETAKRWSLIVENPFRKVPKPKVAEVQPVHFTKTEFSTLLTVIEDAEFRELCIVAVNTGIRAGELRSIQWTDVDFVRLIINVRNSEGFTTKSKKARVIPMNQTVVAILAERKERASSELVFSLEGRQYTSDEVSKGFKRYVLSANVNQKLHFHSLSGVHPI